MKERRELTAKSDGTSRMMARAASLSPRNPAKKGTKIEHTIPIRAKRFGAVAVNLSLSPQVGQTNEPLRIDLSQVRVESHFGQFNFREDVRISLIQKIENLACISLSHRQCQTR